MNDRDEESIPFLEQLLLQAGAPEVTKWRYLMGSLFWIPIESPSIYFHHQLVSFFPNYPYYVILIASYYIWKTVIYPTLPLWLQNIKYFLFVHYAFGIIALFRVILTNPGYLPFFHPITKKKKYTQEELNYGMAIKEEQMDWAKEQPRPPRCVFSQSVGWYILRGDHFCSWIGSWVGLYNHRYFLQTIYYLGVYLMIICLTVIYQFFKCEMLYPWYIHLFCFFASGFFGFLLGSQIISQFFSCAKNITYTEIHKFHGKLKYDNGIINNLETVLGDRRYWYTWPFPFISTKLVYDGFDFPEVDEPDEDTLSKKPTILI